MKTFTPTATPTIFYLLGGTLGHDLHLSKDIALSPQNLPPAVDHQASAAGVWQVPVGDRPA